MKTCPSTVETVAKIVALSISVCGVVSGCDQNGFPFKNATKQERETSVVQTEWADEKKPSAIQKNGSVVRKGEKAQAKRELSNRPMKSNDSSKKNFGQFFIQVGAFLNEKNAISLAQRFRKKGYQVKLVRLKTKKKILHAVRLGGFADEKNAIKQATEISNKENMEVVLVGGSVVKRVVRPKRKESPTDGKPVEKTGKERTGKTLQEQVDKKGRKQPASIRPGTYSFQVGGYLDRKNAEKQMRWLKNKGYNAFIVEMPKSGDNEIWSTVQVGYFNTLLEADGAATAFFNEEKIPAQVLPVDDFRN